MIDQAMEIKASFFEFGNASSIDYKDKVLSNNGKT
jgi:hypothetical protein